MSAPDTSGPSLPLSRRGFLRRGSLLGAALAAPSVLRSAPPAAPEGERYRVAVIGLGRGLALARSSVRIPGVEVAWLCDVDQRRIDRALDDLRGRQDRKPKGTQDLRRVLDDDTVDAVLIATCNHWHAPAGILACRAGKHVYVEKPGSHDPREGELLVEAAREHERVVQMGNQRRTWPAVREAIQKLHEGALGTLRYARCWYSNRRPSIGRGRSADPPAELDWSLWQGPAPERPYKDNLVHYNWHWHWHWGNGELGNNGIHALDLARWGLGVDAPRQVGYVAGRYRYEDDQETPDAGTALYDFGASGASWEQSSCHPRRPEDLAFVTFYGDGGSLEIRGAGYRMYDLDGAETAKSSGPGGEVDHIRNFLQAIPAGGRPHSDIEDAQRSTLLCHLGNIAWRLGRTLDVDPATGRPADDPEVERLWSREYREGWRPEV